MSSPSSTASSSGSSPVSPVHISSVPSYVAIFAALIVMTAITVWVAFYDFGVMNDLVAMAIAVVKATLVILFFMHVKYSTKLTKLTVIAGFVWLFIFFLLLFADYATRGVFGPVGK